MPTCSKYEQGYDANRFEIVISERFCCSVCLLVLKDPVMCKNQHYYCSSCIKEHLANAEFCPTCHEHLSVDTLIQAPRIVTEYLSELVIHCDFYPRGCREVVQLSNLKRHVESCDFSPVQCSNDGCNVLVNKREKLRHEAEVCDYRKSKCYGCGQLKKEVKEMKDEMLYRQDQIKDEINKMKDEVSEVKGEMKEMKVVMNENNDEMKEMKVEMKVIHREVKIIQREVKVMTDQALARQNWLEYEITKEIKREVKNQIRSEMKEMKEQMKKEVHEMRKELRSEMNEMKEEIKHEMREIVMNAVQDEMAEKKDREVEMKNSKKSSEATYSSDAKGNIIVAGGRCFGENKSTECFNWTDQTWTLLDSAVFEGRFHASAFLYQGQMVLAGGENCDSVYYSSANTLICLNVADPASTWKDFAVNLPFRYSCHQVVNYNDRLFISGGRVQKQKDDQPLTSDAVLEVQLEPPYSSKLLTRFPQPRYSHAMELFDDKLFILGGHANNKPTNSVVRYDLINNECKEMPPLPYDVESMATVLWRNYVLVIGGIVKWSP